MFFLHIFIVLAVIYAVLLKNSLVLIFLGLFCICAIFIAFSISVIKYDNVDDNLDTDLDDHLDNNVDDDLKDDASLTFQLSLPLQ